MELCFQIIQPYTTREQEVCLVQCGVREQGGAAIHKEEGIQMKHHCLKVQLNEATLQRIDPYNKT